jgi:tetratricopeptide (TPR) repeat protein
MAAGAIACSDPASELPTDEPVVPLSRVRLDEALRFASVEEYARTIEAFEAVRAEDADAITSLDGLKLVVVYTEVGDFARSDELTRWLVARYRTPTTATDAERSIKGYIVSSHASDPALLAHAVDMARYASQHAAEHGEGEHQGFFDTSLAIALYRVGRFDEAVEWLPNAIGHESLYVRSLALPFFAMTELALDNRTQAEELLQQARQTAAELPAPGSASYAIDWTDILISRMALAEAEAAFAAEARDTAAP